jgi:hypothetical protein
MTNQPGPYGPNSGWTVDRLLWFALTVGEVIAIWWVVLHFVFDVV